MWNVFLLLSLLLWTSAASAEDPAPTPLGDIKAGVRLFQTKNGGFLLVVDRLVTVVSGQIFDLRESDSIDYQYANSEGTIKLVSKMDLALYGPKYVGSRIKVQSLKIFGATVSGGLSSLPGSAVKLQFSDIPREQLRSILQNCSGILTQSTRCEFDAEGEVQPYMEDQVRLTHLQLTEPPKAPLKKP